MTKRKQRDNEELTSGSAARLDFMELYSDSPSVNVVCGQQALSLAL